MGLPAQSLRFISTHGCPGVQPWPSRLRPLGRLKELRKDRTARQFPRVASYIPKSPLMRGMPLAVIAAQLGHADTRMVEKHYGHLAANYVADTVRPAFGTLGIAGSSNVVP